MQFDCARCEELLLDFAYGELDEVTSAAFRRHADSCARCGASLADVRTVREAFSMLPLESPPPTIDAKILAAVDQRFSELDERKRAAQRHESRSIVAKLFDVFRVAALRPQYAMAMLLVLVVGIGLLVAPQMRMTEQAAPGVAPTLIGSGGPELEPAPMPPGAAMPATTETTSHEERSTLEEGNLRQATGGLDDSADGFVADALPDQAAERPAADDLQLRAAGGEQLAREDGRAARDRAPLTLAAPSAPAAAPAPERMITRGMRGGGGGQGDLDEDSSGRLGFTQTPREAEVRSADAPAHAGPADGVRAEAARRSQSWAAPPPPAPAPQSQQAQAPLLVPQQSAPSTGSTGSAYGPAPARRAASQREQQQAGGGPSGLGGAAAASGGQDAYSSGMTAYRAGQYRTAIPELERAVARPGLSSDALATAHYAIARSYHQTGNLAAAASRYVDLMQRFPAYRTNADVNWFAAECYRQLGNTERAEQYYRVAEQSGRYAERVRAKRVQMNTRRRAAPASDAVEAAEPADVNSAAH